MKFNIGDLVQAPDGEKGEVLSVRIDANGTFYAISSKEVDLQRKEIINGVKHLEESELEIADQPAEKETNE